MTLFLNNDHVKELLTMKNTIEALEESYTKFSKGEGVCRPRVDIVIPTSDPTKHYEFGSMDGGSANGYAAIRIKSDIVYESEYNGTVTKEKYCVQPGMYCGLILLFRVENGEPVAFINDGFLQHYRVGADSGIGVKHMAKEGEITVGMLGSGGMARSHIDAFREVRTIKKIKVYSPTKANRELYAKEIEDKYGIETIPYDNPKDVHQEVDVLCSCTDASIPVIQAAWLEPGTHITSIGGRPNEETFSRIDRYLRFGNATVPRNNLVASDEVLTFVTPILEDSLSSRRSNRLPPYELVDKSLQISYADIISGTPGRTSPEQITYSERGNLQGAQFHAVAGRVYEAAIKGGIGNTFPTEWLLQDIID
jgi:ornithine cyclodeaminase/alanine dehydrogenase-like protein (mu-crystallin family)